MKKFLVKCIVLVLMINVVSISNNVVLAAQNGGSTNDYEVKLAVEYDELGGFYEGRAAIRKGELWGFINENFELIVEPKYTEVGDYSEGVVWAKTGTSGMDRCIYILDLEGNILFDTSKLPMFEYGGKEYSLYTDISGCSEGVVELYPEAGYLPVAYITEDESNGSVVKFLSETIYSPSYYNLEGKLLMNSDLLYEKLGYTLSIYAGGVHDGIIRLFYYADDNKNIKTIFMDTEGNIYKIEDDAYKSSEIYMFNDGIAAVKVIDDNNIMKFGFIDDTGNWIIEPEYDDFGLSTDDQIVFDDGLARVKKDGKWGIINTENEVIVDFIYDRIYYKFNNGLYPITSDEKFGFIDEKGTVVTNCIYQTIREDVNEFIRVQKDDKWGNINSKGEQVVDCIYDYLGILEYGDVTYVGMNDKFGAINDQGEVIIDMLYDSIVINNSNEVAIVELNGKYGIVDFEGNMMVDIIYDYISCDFKDEGVAYVGLDNKYGMINENGDVIVDIIYDDFSSIANNIAFMEKDGKYYLIDNTGELLKEVAFNFDFSGYSGITINDEGEMLIRLKQDDKFGYMILNESVLSLLGEDASEVNDAPSSWAEEEVNEAIAYDLVIDEILNNYQQNITREEFCELILVFYEKLSGKEAVLPSENIFTDTTNESVLKANGLGIVNGVGNNRFAPDDNITREEMAVMFYNAIKAVDESYVEKGLAVTYADSDEISSWALDAVGFTSHKGIINGIGNNKMDPKGTASREVAILIVKRSYEKFMNK
jgi:uncharacterized protein YceK